MEPNDLLLLTCGSDNIVKLWELESSKCIRTFSKHTDVVTACAWFPDGKHFVSGGNDSRVFMMDIDGNEVQTWHVAKVNDLAVTSDSKFIIILQNDKRLMIQSIDSKPPEMIFQETDPPTSMELSTDNRYLLVNISSHELHLWDLQERKLIQKYKGQKQSRYVLRSCFGGVNEAFIASGSEDSQMYIWHRESGNLLQILPGHSGTINAVSWNPRIPFMLASCSDDHTIRIWCAHPTTD